MSHYANHCSNWIYSLYRAGAEAIKPNTRLSVPAGIAPPSARTPRFSIAGFDLRRQTALAVITLILSVLGAASIAFAHKQRPMRIRILNRTNGSLSQADLNAAVSAVQIQLTRDFRQYYFVTRSIDLTIGGSRGWKVIVVNTPIDGGKDVGFHSYNANGTPYAKVTIDGALLSSILSHEILEMLADPFCDKREIVDGLGLYYRIDDEQVSDFRLPNSNQDFCGTVDFCY